VIDRVSGRTSLRRDAGVLWNRSCHRSGADPPSASAPRLTTIDVPGATATYAMTINDAGQIVGGYTDVLGTEHGFLLNNGTFTTIDFPGAVATGAFGVIDTEPTRRRHTAIRCQLARHGLMHFTRDPIS
jgi:probable HAF family extracellular repeat protein